MATPEKKDITVTDLDTNELTSNLEQFHELFYFYLTRYYQDNLYQDENTDYIKKNLYNMLKIILIDLLGENDIFKEIDKDDFEDLIDNYKYIVINGYINYQLGSNRKEFDEYTKRLVNYYKIKLFIEFKGKKDLFHEKDEIVIHQYDEYVDIDNRNTADQIIISLDTETKKSQEIKELIEYYKKELDESHGNLKFKYIIEKLDLIFRQKLQAELISEEKDQKQISVATAASKKKKKKEKMADEVDIDAYQVPALPAVVEIEKADYLLRKIPGIDKNTFFAEFIGAVLPLFNNPNNHTKICFFRNCTGKTIYGRFTRMDQNPEFRGLQTNPWNFIHSECIYNFFTSEGENIIIKRLLNELFETKFSIRPQSFDIISKREKIRTGIYKGTETNQLYIEFVIDDIQCHVSFHADLLEDQSHIIFDRYKQNIGFNFNHLGDEIVSTRTGRIKLINDEELLLTKNHARERYFIRINDMINDFLKIFTILFKFRGIIGIDNRLLIKLKYLKYKQKYLQLKNSLL
jgi:hypothetical protein